MLNASFINKKGGSQGWIDRDIVHRGILVNSGGFATLGIVIIFTAK
jgi:hypothetical protein